MIFKDSSLNGFCYLVTIMMTKEELLLELEKRPIPQELLETKEKAIQEFNDFFGIRLQRQFNIYIIYTREEMDIIQEKKTEDWVAGYNKSGQIFIFDPDCYNKETGRTLFNVKKLLKHEITHSYFSHIVGNNKPRWFNEGLAEYLPKRKTQEKTLEEIVNVIDYDEDFNGDQYAPANLLVNLLIEKFGKEKILLLLRSYHSKEYFLSAFKEIYGFELTKEKLIENLKE